jgi:hypothetical protein
LHAALYQTAPHDIPPANNALGQLRRWRSDPGATKKHDSNVHNLLLTVIRGLLTGFYKKIINSAKKYLLNFAQ